MPNQANCDPVVVAHHEQTGDAAVQAGRFKVALCKSGSYRDAKTLFLKIGKDSLAQICAREGFDPRVQP